ncbi:MAG: alpha/beta hydrolase [Myxococcota bacterium]|nr:alpha/beta hydrolase [Myxococcota bacterium]
MSTRTQLFNLIVCVCILALSSCATPSTSSKPAFDVPDELAWDKAPSTITRDGRVIAYAEYGDPEGAPVIFMHGGPGSRFEGVILDRAAKQAHVRIIAPDRPGLGESDMAREVTLETTAGDMLFLSKALNLDRPVLMGWSGGGVPAVVTGGANPEHFAGVISLAGYTKLDREELEAMVPEPDQTAMQTMKKHPWRFRQFFRLTRFTARRLSGTYWRTLVRDASEADKRVYNTDGMRAFFMADQKEALRPGIDGITADAKLSYAPDWGFSPSTSCVRLHIYHGTEDTRVPLDFARDLAARFPNANLHIIDGVGHMFPITHSDMLVARARALWDTRAESCTQPAP